MRTFALLVVFIVTLFAEQWCIFYSTQTKIYDNEAESFKKRFQRAYIVHDGNYYRFLIGPFASKKEAYPTLKKAKRYHKDAFLRICPQVVEKKSACESNISKYKTTKEQVKFDNKPIQIGEVFKRPILKKRARNIRKSMKVKNGSKVKSLSKVKSKKNTAINEEKVASKTLSQLQKEPYYRLSFYEFMNRFLYKSPYGKQESLNYRLQKLDALLEEVPYNWDLFLQATVSYSKFIDFNLAENKEFLLQGGIGLSKRLFDSGFFVKSSIKRLRERLAKSEYLNAMDKLYLYGAQIYLNALTMQKVKELYEANFFEQKAFKEVVHERYRAKVATRVDDIDAQDDLLNIKKQLLERMYAYLYSDYLLRNSAELEVKQPLKLSWFGVSQEPKELEEYYKNALLHSPLIQSQKIKEAIEKKRLVKSRYFFVPQVDFNTLVYEEYRKDLSITPSQTATGLNYQVDFSIRIPLYNQNFFDDLQRSRVRWAMEKERLKAKIKDVMRDIHKSYNEIAKLKNKRAITKKQLELAKEKVEITKKRYVSGIGIYRDYSDAITEFLAYQEELYNIDAQLLMSQIYLNLLEGIRRPYEQD